MADFRASSMDGMGAGTETGTGKVGTVQPWSESVDVESGPRRAPSSGTHPLESGLKSETLRLFPSIFAHEASVAAKIFEEAETNRLPLETVLGNNIDLQPEDYLQRAEFSTRPIAPNMFHS